MRYSLVLTNDDILTINNRVTDLGGGKPIVE